MHQRSGPSSEHTLFGAVGRELERFVARHAGYIGVDVEIAMHHLPGVDRMDAARAVLDELARDSAHRETAEAVAQLLGHVHTAAIACRPGERNAAAAAGQNLIGSKRVIRQAIVSAHESENEHALLSRSPERCLGDAAMHLQGCLAVLDIGDAQSGERYHQRLEAAIDSILAAGSCRG